eukprot:102232-Chlamydomonas_euryale.AAC.1
MQGAARAQSNTPSPIDATAALGRTRRKPLPPASPVRQLQEAARLCVKAAEAAVRAAHNTHAVPQPCGTQVLVNHIGGAVELVAIGVEVAPLAHVVDLHSERGGEGCKWLEVGRAASGSAGEQANVGG